MAWRRAQPPERLYFVEGPLQFRVARRQPLFQCKHSLCAA